MVLLTFANDRYGDSDGYLRNLVKEQRQISRALESARPNIRLVVRNNVCLDDLFDLFAEHNDDIVAFHYGGHANPDALLFEDHDGRPVAARIKGVAERLGQLPALSLVFLNGCTTAPHVRQIQRHCAVPIIATDVAIKDSVACDFAHRFYADLGRDRTIRHAYDSAESRLKAEVEGPASTRAAFEDSHRSGMTATLEMPTVTPGAHGTFERVTHGLRLLRNVIAHRQTWPWRLHAPTGHSASLDWRLSRGRAAMAGDRAWAGIVGLLLLLALGGVFTALAFDTPTVMPPVAVADAARSAPDASAPVDARAAPARAGSLAVPDEDDDDDPPAIGEPPDMLRRVLHAPEPVVAPQPAVAEETTAPQPAIAEETTAPPPRPPTRTTRTTRRPRPSAPSVAELEAQIRRALDPTVCRCADAAKTIEVLSSRSPVRARRYESRYKQACRWLTGPCVDK